VIAILYVCVIVAERRGLEGLEPKDQCFKSSTVEPVWGGRSIAPKPVDRRQTDRQTLNV
jgi:hypothetical protein